MGLYLDSAQTEDAERAVHLGFLDGITTNPISIARTGRAAMDVLADLTTIFDGHIFYTVSAPTLEARLDEAWQAYDIRPDRVVIKIPATTENLSLIPRLSAVDIAITAVFTPAQAFLAAEAGADYVMPYVGKMTTQLGDGIGAVKAMVDILRGYETQIIATSITTIEEGLAALQVGAHHIALPMQMINEMGEHQATYEAIKEFTL